MIEKAKTILEQYAYMNCRFFVQRLTGVDDIESLDLADSFENHSILWWGSEQGYLHVAYALNQTTILQVPEWGGKLEILSLAEVEKTWGQANRIYRLKEEKICI